MICRPTPENIARAAELLRAGELVALPTETVYGLGADAADDAAVTKIFAAKDRPADHPLIVHLADPEQLTEWAREIPMEAIALARAFWPGPLTLILKKEADVSDTVTGGQDTVGLRVPDHPVALALLRAFGGGVAAPSANRFGRISPTTAQHVQEELGESVAMILDGGPCDVGIESTILDLSRGEPVILRPGMIGRDAIAAVIGRQPRLKHETESAPRVSGALAAHYAPRTSMRMASKTEIAEAQADCAVLTLAGESAPGRYAMSIDAPFDAHGYAHELYANLRALDAAGASLILVENLPADSSWDAVRDRLGRAVVGSGEDDET
ncbi:L-threonylcarbamoyladenylate synthase [Uliginosibacterium sp. 31-16]|uniref:L-threonylcarbamoyladenylate synthase n=1 Tax=Uliginosibacterium sp. 31-16 TaxID=3068315 RepID=UPI00273F44FF|nr:L-threonylcarbamoyladenylate synthase [Uliginosibacterium sp. 31-16]MDP5241177.1 L-threonylcarbamoyladenylate synthase [Uliginosibacterium sp. 31-16]